MLEEIQLEDGGKYRAVESTFRCSGCVFWPSEQEAKCREAFKLQPCTAAMRDDRKNIQWRHD